MERKGYVKSWEGGFLAEGTASAKAPRWMTIWHFFKKGKMVGVAKA